MRHRTTILTVALTTATLLAGCHGPTKAGKEARANAHDRIDAVHAAIIYDQAEQALESGQVDKAAELIGRTLERYPEVADYHILAGRVALERHRLEPAMNGFTRAIEINPDAHEAHYYAGIVAERWSDDEQAAASFMRAHELDGTSPHYLLAAAEALVALGEFDAAAEIVAEEIAYFEHNTALRQLQGQIAMLQGKPADAVEFFAEARLLNPDDLLLVEELAWAQFEAGQHNKCYATLTSLRPKLPEERPDLMRLEAQCLSLMDRLGEARQLYHQLVRMEPTEPDLWVELGMIAWQMGDFPRVAQSGVRTTALAPGRFEGYFFKGINERHHGNLDSAITLMQDACRRCDHVAMPHLLLGAMLEQVDREEAASEAYRMALQIEPHNRQAQVLLSRLNHGGGAGTAVTTVDPGASPE